MQKGMPENDIMYFFEKGNRCDKAFGKLEGMVGTVTDGGVVGKTGLRYEKRRIHDRFQRRYS